MPALLQPAAVLRRLLLTVELLFVSSRLLWCWPCHVRLQAQCRCQQLQGQQLAAVQEVFQGCAEAACAGRGCRRRLHQQRKHHSGYLLQALQLVMLGTCGTSAGATAEAAAAAEVTPGLKCV